MANPGRHPDPSDLTDGAELLDEALARANPNPGRVGCPRRDVLIALARRERTIGDPAYEHLLKCSPCYQEFRALVRAADGRRRTTSARRWWVSAPAAAVILAALGTWFVLSSGEPDIAPGSAPPVQTAELQVEVDLRKYTVMRSEEPTSDLPPLSLPRGRLAVTIQLPTGSEAGSYEIQVLDSDARPLASARGTAQIRNFVTTLQATIDLHLLNPGGYQLGVRREGDDWRLFPVRVE